MTEQEERIQKQIKDAIEVLGFLKKDFENKAKPRCKFARVRAGLFFGIQALEKQVPYKPQEYEDKYYGCKCGEVLLEKWEEYPKKLMSKSWGLPYCLGCGQKLDWQ